MYRVFVVGSVNMDITIKTDHIPENGETLIGDDLSITPGGKGANQAYGANRLGCELRFIGRIGNDIFGKDLLDHFTQSNIDTSNLLIDSIHSTGVALIAVDINGDNTIIVSSGANMFCGEEEFALFKESFTNNDILLIQNEIPLILNIKLAQYVNSIGGTVIWDPAPYNPTYLEIIKYVDYITPNKSEAEQMTGLIINDNSDVIRSLQKLASLNASCVPIITLGSKGLAYIDNGNIVFQSAFEIKVESTVGAGDSFASGFAYALSQKKILSESIRFGSVCATLTVTKNGAQISMPSLKNVTDFIASIESQ